MGNPVVSIIFVNFNTSEDILFCIDSISTYVRNLKYEIIIVDNHSKQDQQQILKDNFQNESLYFLNYNTGFSYACNYGMIRSRGEYILLLNPDTYLIEDSIIKMKLFLENSIEAGAVGPNLVDVNGGDHMPYGKFPTIKRLIFEALYLHKFQKSKIKGAEFRNISQTHKSVEIDWLSGACIMLKRSVYNTVGGFDEQFHLYNEDVDWCLRIRKRGWRIYYLPGTKVVHKRGVSTHRDYYVLVTSRFKSRLIYVRKHFSFINAFVFQVSMIFGLILRLFVSTFLIYSQANEKKERMRGYLAVLKLYCGFRRLTKKSFK